VPLTVSLTVVAMMRLHAPSGLGIANTQPAEDALLSAPPQLQNRVSLITAMPFSKTDRP
jgi:hypothetical protein